MDFVTLLFLFVLGICIGSFLGVVIDRLPREESIWRGRSYCEYCKKKLTFIDLVPLFSFIFSRGKCRYCHKKLSWYYPIIEATAGILFVFVGFNINIFHPVEFVYYLFIVSALISIFFIDLKYGIIPLPIVLSALLAALIFVILNNQSLIIGNFLSAIGAFSFFLALFFITRRKGIGFGDVIYVFLMGFLLGFPGIILGLYIAFLSGAIVSLILIAVKKKKFKGSTVPFGPFLVFGTLVGLFFGQSIITMALRYLLN
ncbi:prepilin peptidase [Candidatus Roizmanbacteria bacterium]|nr:prepilin peptidase [Candidatus Roizmanbacteria bacterium]